MREEILALIDTYQNPCLLNEKLKNYTCKDRRNVVKRALHVELHSNVSENITKKKTKIHILQRQFKRKSIKIEVCHKNAKTPKLRCFTKVHMLTEC